ncbi:DUF6794 domain-containing protein [Roseibacillus persicicus]|uniref:DUF6794 domain-containing protein n=1 Tax=Roseibacillus persicicus TaxID=454148 RepID=A0A918WQH7_9BACT|nr:DUF6794 domain-containing protein [Roseibacillus persicicus]GHC67986.1 hypothetical protein GCM10007100_40120 [Roseibacillus persicicus]
MRILYCTLVLVACEQRDTENLQEAGPNDRPQVVAQESSSERFENLVAEFAENLTEEARKSFLSTETAEEAVDHFGWGMSLRNGELNQRNSETRQLLVRHGIYHRDDLSSILMLSVIRKVRNEPIKFKEQVDYYRSYWQELDIIAPTQIACAECDLELEVLYYGSNKNPKHPEREYFYGACRSCDQAYLFYHEDGWLPYEQIVVEQVVPAKSDRSGG